MRPLIIQIIVSAFVLHIFLLSVAAYPGDLDQSFGVGGRVTLTGTAGVSRIRIQPDGKILVLSPYQGLARYDAIGRLDPSFGAGGIVFLYPMDVELLPNGKILVATAAGSLSQLDQDGSLDHNFATQGTFTADFPGYFRECNKASRRSDDKIMLLCYSDDGADTYLYRLSQAGVVDQTFGVAGRLDMGQYLGYPGELIVLPDDSFLIRRSEGGIIFRYSSQGILQGQFGVDGQNQYISGGNMVRTVDGKLIVLEAIHVFDSQGPIVTQNRLRRFHGSGHLDNSFGQSGTAIISDSNPVSFRAGAVSVQADGKFVVVGGKDSSFAAVRLGQNGAVDTSFGANGWVLTQFSNTPARTLSAVSVQPNGMIVSAGDLDLGNNSSATGIVRYRGDRKGSLFDFDGDLKADPSVFSPTDGIWIFAGSQSDLTSLRWGSTGDLLVPADYDGDGRTDTAIYRNGVWWVAKSAGGHEVISWGLLGDTPVPADYDGDGKADPAVFRNGVWWILKSSGGSEAVSWGVPGDRVVPADYDGDGKSDPAVFRNGTWWILQSSGSSRIIPWGQASDKLVPGDYNGDGQSDPAIFRDGTWWILNSSGGTSIFNWGFATDLPVPADYDGDGKTDAAIFRNGVWWVLRSTDEYTSTLLGTSGDIPVPFLDR